MTDQQHAVLTDYVRSIADGFGLRDWAIEVDRQPAPEGAAASVCCISGRRSARIRFHWDIRHRSPRDIRNDVVHELLHCHFAATDAVVEDNLGKHSALSDHEHDFIAHVYRRQVEYSIDAVATAIDPFFPLIKWGAA